SCSHHQFCASRKMTALAERAQDENEVVRSAKQPVMSAFSLGTTEGARLAGDWRWGARSAVRRTCEATQSCL
ncbi:MAG: hypothetical protein ACLFO5_07835, partial [Opitutales bacterium]